jgi:hypothetical protein
VFTTVSTPMAKAMGVNAQMEPLPWAATSNGPTWATMSLSTNCMTV